MKKLLIFSCFLFIALITMSFKEVSGVWLGEEFEVAILESEADGVKYKVVADDIKFSEDKSSIEETPIRMLNGNGTLARGTEVLICPGDGVSCKVKITIKGKTGEADLGKAKGLPDVLIKDMP